MPGSGTPGVSEEPTYRERLLEGLATSIREKGLQGTQIADIVRHARTSRRTFYECFPDKQACFLDLIESAFRSIYEEVAAALDLNGQWDEQIGQGIDAFIKALADDPALTVSISHELPALGVRGYELHRRIERYAQLMCQVSTAPQWRDAGIEPLSLELAVMLVGGVGELVDRAMHSGSALEPLAPVIKELFTAVLRPRA